MMDTKDLLMSKTFWGSIITALGLALAQFGVHIHVGQTASAIVTLIGLGYTITGRVNAKTQIGSIAGMKLKPTQENQK